MKRCLSMIMMGLLAAGCSGDKVNSDAWSGNPDRQFITAVMQKAQNERREFQTQWMGVKALQFPADLLTYQQLIHEVKPDYVIETGTYYGGLSLYLATILRSLNLGGKVITIDIKDERWNHTKSREDISRSSLDDIIFLKGSSTSNDIYQEVAALVQDKKVLVILDSLHTQKHVLKELELYAQLVPVGSYLMVNDTHLDGTAWVKGKPGPFAAVKRFLKKNEDFVINHTKQKFMISCLHSGILERVR